MCISVPMLLSPSFSGEYKQVSSEKGDIPYTVTNDYRPQTKLREGNVFKPVCHSVHRGRVSACGFGGCLPLGPGVHPPLGRHPQPDTLRCRDDHRSGRYGFHWNAFLF